MRTTTTTTRAAFGLCGTGGFAREVMPVVAESLTRVAPAHPDRTWSRCFVDLDPQRAEVNGHAVLSEDAFFALDCSAWYFNVAIADSRLRERIARRCVERGATPLSLRSTTVVTYEGNTIGEGAILCAHSTITSNARIGRFFHANLYSYVAHDCVIGDFVTFAPNVHCNGNVHIHDHAYIGTGAILRQGTPDRPLVIGEGAVVGMGAVVTRDVAPYTTVVGNPARPLIKGPPDAPR